MPQIRKHTSRAFTESNVALHVERTRKAKGWTYQQFADRMTAIGFPIQPSAIHKLTKGRPPRRITVDEMLAYAQVLGTSVISLLTSPQVEDADDLEPLVEQWRSALARRDNLRHQYEIAGRDLDEAARQVTARAGHDRWLIDGQI